MDHLCYLCILFVMLSRLFYCCLVVTCWERALLLALVCNVKFCDCLFPIWYPGSGLIIDSIDYEDCSHMNASTFITFFTYMLQKYGKRFYDGLYVTF